MKNNKIKELAELCDVTTESIRQWCKKYDVIKNDNGKFIIDSKTEKQIINYYNIKKTNALKSQEEKPSKTKNQAAKSQATYIDKPLKNGEFNLKSQEEKPSKTKNQAAKSQATYIDEMLESFKNQLKDKNKMIDVLCDELKEKNEQIESLNTRLVEDAKLLDQEQQLRLVAERKLEEQQVLIEARDVKKNKHWWQFWK